MIPVKYRGISGEGAIASYNYSDLASGVGYAVYYLLITNDNTGQIRKLVQTSDVGTEAPLGENSTSYVSYDITFETPRIIEGTAFLSGEVDHGGTNSTITASLYYVDGTTAAETTIGTEAVTSSKTADVGYSLAFNVSLKHFKIGDKLRLKVKSGDASMHISADPSGNFPAGILPSKLAIPFKIDI
jgi:hypothetical protein